MSYELKIPKPISYKSYILQGLHIITHNSSLIAEDLERDRVIFWIVLRMWETLLLI